MGAFPRIHLNTPVGLLSLFLNLRRPSSLNDPDKVRRQWLPRVAPVERAVFDQPGRLEAFITSGM
jgi:hypothetical protein